MRAPSVIIRSLVLAAVIAAPTPASSEDPPRARDCASVLLTCLGYVNAEDPVATRRLEQGVRLLALHNGELSSRTLSNDVVAAAKDWDRTHPSAARDLRVSAASAELYTSPEALVRLIDEGSYGVVFVSEGLSGAVDEIGRVAVDSKVLTTCVSSEGVRRGLALGFVVEERRLVILLNRAAAAAAGFRFRGALLRRATLVGEEERR